jgi:hypothetical protein
MIRTKVGCCCYCLVGHGGPGAVALRAALGQGCSCYQHACRVAPPFVCQ